MTPTLPEPLRNGDSRCVEVSNGGGQSATLADSEVE